MKEFCVDFVDNVVKSVIDIVSESLLFSSVDFVLW